jgi:hypothetical protein
VFTGVVFTQKVREAGRIVNVAVVVAVGVNATGDREVLGIDVITNEDARAGPRSYGRWWHGACRACNSSSPTRTKA